MKKITVLLLALCLVFLTACGGSSPSDALKADMEDAKASPDEIIGDLGEDGFGEEATKLLVDKVLEFEYELGEEKIDGDTATVETTITAYSIGAIFGEVITELITEAYANPTMSEDEMMAKMDALLIEKLTNAEKTYSQTVTIILKKKGSNWEVQENDDMANALTGGILDFIEAAS